MTNANRYLDLSERMDRAGDIIRRAHGAGMAVELRPDGKLLLRNFTDERQALRDEIILHCKDIAEWLSIPDADASERALEEYHWSREFAEEFARTLWRRIGRLTEHEFLEFYNLAASEYGDATSPKVEPGFSAFMAIADARLEQLIEVDRRAHELAERDGCAPEEWAKALSSINQSRARQGRWKREPGNDRVEEVAEIPF